MPLCGLTAYYVRGALQIGRPLDLREFYAAVQEHGGYDVAVAKKRWGKIAKRMGIDLSAVTNAGFVLRCACCGALDSHRLWWACRHLIGPSNAMC